MSDDVVVVVEPPLPDVVVVVEPPLLDVVVVLSEVALAGRNGADGADGIDGTDALGSVDELARLAIITHIDSETPHPIYDEGPSLALLYQNAKV